MLFFLRKTNNQKSTEANYPQDKAALAIASAILYRQKQLAQCCNSRYERLSMPGRKVLLLLFCLLFGGTSLWFLAKGVWPEQKLPSIAQRQSSSPKATVQAGKQPRDRTHPDVKNKTANLSLPKSYPDSIHLLQQDISIKN